MKTFLLSRVIVLITILMALFSFGTSIAQNKNKINSKFGTGYHEIKSEPKVPVSQDTVTILIVYTPSAAAWSAANETNIDTTIAKLMRDANLVLQNSNTLLTLKLVHHEQVNYTEVDSDQDYKNLKNQNDGQMDNVHTLRDSCCADLVLLLANICYKGGASEGLSNVAGDPATGFCVVAVSLATYKYAAVHELGHLFGCGHHFLQDPGAVRLFSFSSGWDWTGSDNNKYCSVMSYYQGDSFLDGLPRTRVPYFSNPGTQYNGVATGDALFADNARTIRQIKSVIAAYRSDCCPTIQAAGFTSSSTDTTMTIGWTRGNGNSVLVLAREGSAVNASPVIGKTYSANTAFGTGEQIGIGNFVVYNGSGTSANLTSLKVGTNYYLSVYEYKSVNKCYLSPALTGNKLTTATYCEAGSNSLPGVQTAPVTSILIYTATTGGTVSCDAGSTITARGVCYGLQHLPTLSGNFTINGADTGTFISNLSGLIPETVYYVRAYATNSLGTAYGDEKTFKTKLCYYGEYVNDYDGDLYLGVVLGTQQWFAWNLTAIHYNNGDAIPYITLGSAWYNTTSGAQCVWGNLPGVVENYGRLYNWYAVADQRNICPTGWHVPTNDEWTILTNYLGGSTVAGGKLKEDGTTHWNSPNTGATNKSGFTALPGGVADWNYVDYGVTFYSIRDYGYFWTSTEVFGTGNARYKLMGKNNANIGGSGQPKYLGQSVRCIKN